MNEQQDIEINCSGCGAGFTWTKGEQAFLEGLKNDGKIKDVIKPKRCSDCRIKKHQSHDDSARSY